MTDRNVPDQLAQRLEHRFRGREWFLCFDGDGDNRP